MGDEYGADRPSLSSELPMGEGIEASMLRDSVRRLVPLLKDPNHGTKAAYDPKELFRASLECGAKAVPDFRRALEDDRRSVCYWVSETLGYIGPPAADATPELLALTDGWATDVRSMARWALTRIRPKAEVWLTWSVILNMVLACSLAACLVEFVRLQMR